MAKESTLTSIPVPDAWQRYVKSAILHTISLVHLVIIQARGRAMNTFTGRMRLAVQLERAQNENSLLEAEMRVKDARMGLIDATKRPHYRPIDRLEILEVKAARGWSAAQTARKFLVQPATIGSWLKRADESGPSALVKTPEPVNRFPDFVRHIVRRLKLLCPTVGKKRIAQTLARAGLHLGVATVGRMLKEPSKPPQPAEDAVYEQVVNERKQQPVTAKYANHVWQVDLTVVPTSAGFWVPWVPNALAQLWPYCWWAAVVIDHFSRRVMGFTVFRQEPTSIQVRSFLGRVISAVGRVPKYVICDKGGQFFCPSFERWSRQKGIEPRYASTGSLRATAVIERFLKSLKNEMLRRIQVPLRRGSVRRQISLYLSWYHEFRPHQGLGGRTPAEVCDELRPANTRARFEPRPKWPKDSPCALPHAEPRKRCPQVALVVRFLDGNRNLPIVELKKAA